MRILACARLQYNKHKDYWRYQRHCYRKTHERIVILMPDKLIHAMSTVEDDSMYSDEILAEAQKSFQNGQYPLAQSRYLELLAADPNNATALYGLAVISHNSGDYTTAERFINRAIDHVSGDAHLHNTLGMIKRAQGDFEAAIACHEQALALAPGDDTALSAIGTVYRDRGNFVSAIEYYTKAVASCPRNTFAWSNLGYALWQQERHDEATEAFRKAVDAGPDQALTYENLGTVLHEQGDYEAALECYAQAVELARTPGSVIRYNTAIPIIPDSIGQIAASRIRLRDTLASMLDSDLSILDPVREIAKTNFSLAYQGCNDRDLQNAFAELYRKACPGLSYVAPHCSGAGTSPSGRKINVGFISRHFRNHSIGRTSSGIIANLPREHLHVVAVFLEPPMDEMGHFIARAADEILILPDDLTGARTVLAEKQLDILFYQDIGMDVFTYFLAFSRLAPVQCTTFGHPVTSGIPSIDYYISTEYWEPADGEQHYSEKLLKLRNSTAIAYYDRPMLPNPLLLHENFHLDAQDNIYICPQALFKFHPDFDEILAGILRADGNGRLVLIEGRFKQWTSRLSRRFRSVMPDVMDRITFLPQHRSIDFINLIAISDVMLDTLHFCGFNTTLEAFAAGTPVVTLPGEFMRGRHTAAFYRRMNIGDCVAASKTEYIEIAVRLGTDPEYRAEISNKIAAARDMLWCDQNVLQELADTFINLAGLPAGR